MRKNILFLFIFLFFIIIVNNIVYGTENVILTSDKDIIQKDDTFTISININDISVAALITKLSFDSSKIEYVSGPEDSNIVGNKIIYMWCDESGGKNPKGNGEIASFTFKATESGKTSFGIEGVFYDSNENELPVTFSDTQVYIQDEITTVYTQYNNIENNENISDDNAYLKIMRLNVEGTSPNFDKRINDYVIIVDTIVNNLEVIAIPENSDATVQVTGTTDLKTGLNKIIITVTSKDGSNKNIYTISVTKTGNLQKANPNLGSLAIEYSILSPEFDSNITNYLASIPSNVENLNILAVPENQNATASITGFENLQFGDNTVYITITGEDKITKKTYIVNAYRMTNEEEEVEIQKQTEDFEMSQEIIQRTSLVQETSKGEIEQNEEKGVEDFIETMQNVTKSKTGIIIIMVLLIVIALVIMYIVIKKRKNKT